MMWLSQHFIVKCSCGKVIAQCRCMGPKTERVMDHPACEQAGIVPRSRPAEYPGSDPT